MYNYDFYIASIILLIILLTYNVFFPVAKNLASKTYIGLLVLCLTACTSDVISGGILMEYFPDRIVLNYFAQLVACMTLHLIPLSYFFYMVVLSRHREKIPPKIYPWGIPAVIVQILILTTPLTGWIFTYSGSDGYARGPFMPLALVITGFYIIMAVRQILVYGKDLGTRYKFMTIIFVVVITLSMVIQMVTVYYVLLGAAASLNCLIMQLTLQNPKLIQEANEKEIEARKEAEHANRAKSSFLANMSHEIRTPMNAICGMAEILGESKLGPIERDYVRTIQEASQSLLHIIDDVLDFSKIDADQMELVEEEYRFDELLMGVEDIIAARLQGRNIRFEINVGENAPITIRGDKMKIHQILINILGNAVKFTEKGKISLDVSFYTIGGGRQEIEFLVTDTGIGIKQEDMSKLFSRFSQVDNKYTRKVQGTGLGLVLSKKLANLMEGDITVTSEYGVGSCFKITLVQKAVEHNSEEIRATMQKFRAFVFEKDQEERWYLSRILSQLGVSTIFLYSERQLFELGKQQAQEKNKQNVLFYSFERSQDMVMRAEIPFRKVALMEYYTKGAEGQNIEHYLRKPLDIFRVYRVLVEEPVVLKSEKRKKITLKDTRIAIVDDNRVNVKVAISLLKELGALPEAYTSGAGILKALEKGREYDIIFMDHMMPEMDGVEASRRIRMLPGDYGKNCVIIALTANAIDGVEKEYQEAGMDDWLFKPVNMERLQEKIVKYLPPEKVVETEILEEE